MLYRMEVLFPRKNEPDFLPEECADQMFIGPACIPELAESMAELGLPAPRKLTNQRTRFFFTELGWKEFGEVLAAKARALGYELRITSRRNRPRGDAIFEDEFQMALLPLPKRSRRKSQHKHRRRSQQKTDMET